MRGGGASYLMPLAAEIMGFYREDQRLYDLYKTLSELPYAHRLCGAGAHSFATDLLQPVNSSIRNHRDLAHTPRQPRTLSGVLATRERGEIWPRSLKLPRRELLLRASAAAQVAVMGNPQVVLVFNVTDTDMAPQVRPRTVEAFDAFI